MKTQIIIQKCISRKRALRKTFLAFIISFAFSHANAQNKTAAPLPKGTSKVWGKLDGVEIEGLVEGPSATAVPLQVACVFEYNDGDIYNSPPALPAGLNGMVHLDKALDGLITELRKSGKFAGHAYETILITPPEGKLGAKRLLLIGLGDRTKFSPDLMMGIGQIAVREALKLGVNGFAFGSDLKDGGIDSPTAAVAANEVKGIFMEYRTQAWLKGKQMTQYKPLSKVILLAGPTFFTDAGMGISDAINQLNKN